MYMEVGLLVCLQEGVQNTIIERAKYTIRRHTTYLLRIRIRSEIDPQIRTYNQRYFRSHPSLAPSSVFPIDILCLFFCKFKERRDARTTDDLSRARDSVAIGILSVIVACLAAT